MSVIKPKIIVYCPQCHKTENVIECPDCNFDKEKPPQYRTYVCLNCDIPDNIRGQDHFWYVDFEQLMFRVLNNV